MQFLPPLTRDPKVAAREAPAGAHLPYARHIDDVTIQTRDGLLMQTIRLGGLLFETADSAELNYRAGLRDAMLRTLGSSRFAIYHHVVRRRAEAALRPVTVDDFSARLDARWQERLGSKQLYVNELFLTIIRRPLLRHQHAADPPLAAAPFKLHEHINALAHIVPHIIAVEL
jgi:type IV secretion system protein VirB4